MPAAASVLAMSVLLPAASGASLCMEFAEGRPLSRVQVATCDGSLEQQWSLTSHDSPNAFLITPMSSPEYCLVAPAWRSMNKGGELAVGACDDASWPGMLWDFDEGAYQIRANGQDNCVDAGDESVGFHLRIRTCSDLSQQSWGYDADTKTIYLSDSRGLQRGVSLAMTEPVPQGSPRSLRGSSSPEQAGVNTSSDSLGGALRGSRIGTAASRATGRAGSSRGRRGRSAAATRAGRSCARQGAPAARGRAACRSARCPAASSARGSAASCGARRARSAAAPAATRSCAVQEIPLRRVRRGAHLRGPRHVCWQARHSCDSRSGLHLLRRRGLPDRVRAGRALWWASHATYLLGAVGFSPSTRHLSGGEALAGGTHRPPERPVIADGGARQPAPAQERVRTCARALLSVSLTLAGQRPAGRLQNSTRGLPLLCISWGSLQRHAPRFSHNEIPGRLPARPSNSESQQARKQCA
ncbi:unnamed protein product [Prorocentrum cordatum]|uniref:Ricin B lectin domain-containing protein n=1 Tax=Prorocentrum cordatum TaxID=2364126 RepID=A0ABN9QKB9_9DINO|nr:unnamed protein product [Polarella glacialis]